MVIYMNVDMSSGLFLIESACRFMKSDLVENFKLPKGTLQRKVPFLLSSSSYGSAIPVTPTYILDMEYQVAKSVMPVGSKLKIR